MEIERGIYIRDDGTIRGPLYGEIFELVAGMCRLAGLRVAKLEIGLDPEIEPSVAQELLARVITQSDVENGDLNVDCSTIRIGRRMIPVVGFLRAYYGAIQGKVPTKRWVIDEAVMTLYAQNKTAIERLVTASMEARQEESRTVTAFKSPDAKD